MRVLIVSLSVILAALRPAHVAAGVTWSLGAHASLSRVSGDVEDSGTSATVGLGSSVLTYQPSLRLALGTDRHGHDVVFDSGLLVLDQGGSTLSLYVVSAGYQWAARPRWRTSPILGANVGLYHEGSDVASTSELLLGIGAGLRHVVGDNHGALRAEFRWERLTADHDTGRPKLTTIGARLGFDLWL
jgi:hypothetical protein